MKSKYFFEYWKSVFPYVTLFLMSIIVLLVSPFAPFVNNVTSTDSSVYIYCSEQILKGKIMYKELFDHKGPMLYVFNIIGLLIGRGNTAGIWFVELAILFCSLLFIYNSINLYFNKSIALLSTLSCSILYFQLMAGGNITEEYAIPFISVSMYYFLLFFKYHNLKYYHFVIIALCCICAFLIKPNFIALWIVGYFFVFNFLLKDKKLKKLIPIAIVTIVTFMVICTPFAIYFFYTDSWADFKFCFWDFNRAYSDLSFLRFLIVTCRRLWFTTISSNPVHVFLFVFFIGMLVMGFKHLQYKVEVCFFILVIILTSFSISLSLQDFPHYYLLFIPLFAFPYATVYHFIKDNLGTNITLINLFFLLLLIYTGVNELKREFFFSKYEKRSIENFIVFIKENSELTDKISVVGNDCWIYTFSDRESVSKYSYQFPLITVKKYGELIAESYIKDIENGKPRIIITVDYLNRQNLIRLNEILDTKYEKAMLIDSRFSCWLLK